LKTSPETFSRSEASTSDGSPPVVDVHVGAPEELTEDVELAARPEVAGELVDGQVEAHAGPPPYTAAKRRQVTQTSVAAPFHSARSIPTFCSAYRDTGVLLFGIGSTRLERAGKDVK
jgi:hypothetical protein